MLSMTGSIVLRINIRSLLQYFISYLQSQPLLLKMVKSLRWNVSINAMPIIQIMKTYQSKEKRLQP